MITTHCLVTTTHYEYSRTLRTAYGWRVRVRYNIKSRKSLYGRLDGLGITLDKKGNKSYATDEQVKLLDQQDEHIKNGGTIKNFVPTKHAEVTVHNTPPNPDILSIVETTQYAERYPLGHTAQLTTQPQLLGDIVEAVTKAIAEKMNPADPLWYMSALERARVSQWELTTSEVQKLIGVKPNCKKGKRTFKRGSFIFVKSGRIGNQTA